MGARSAGGRENDTWRRREPGTGPPDGACVTPADPQPTVAVSCTSSSVTEVHSMLSGPALALSPSAHVTVVSPTPSDARPSCTPPRVTVLPRISASAPSPLRVTVQDDPEQLTLSEVK